MRRITAIVIWVALMPVFAWGQSYQQHPEAQKFISAMVSKHGFAQAELAALFAQAEKKQSILDAIARPAEKVLSWKEYRRIFVVPSRIDKGATFWQSHAGALKRMEQEYGVPAEIVVAVIGVETRYGDNKGSYRVLDSLSTLAFDYPPRADFFRAELENFLLLAREQKQDPLSLLGSYAGAMGYGQFMPSSYRSYAVDFDGDGLADVWNNPVDAIGSVANYLRRHGWHPGEGVAIRSRVNAHYDQSVINDSLQPQYTVAALTQAGFAPVETLNSQDKAIAIKLNGENGAEFWLGLHNFYVITRYNHNAMYAMAVYQLGQMIKQSNTVAAR